MAIRVIMPALEVAQETGKLVSWLKKEGDSVHKGELLLEIETDKAVMEVEAEADGILAGVAIQPGDEVPVGQVIAWILAPGESIPGEEKAAEVAAHTPAAVPAKEAALAPEAIAEQIAAHASQISPKARRLAKEADIDIGKIKGTGPGGEILASDIRDAIEAQALSAEPVAVVTPATNPVATAAAEQVTLSSIGRLMAERTTQSWTTVPHFFVEREVDATGLNRVRAALGPSIEQAHGVKLTHTDLLIALVARTLVKHPRLNASWIDNGIRLNPAVNISIAIAVEDGVVAAVVANAHVASLGEIATHRRELTERARAGRLRASDLAGGTFTVSNLGMFHVDSFSAIITPPQAAILAVGAIKDRVVPIQGGVGVRPMLRLTVSADHRIADGQKAAAFLHDLAAAIEEPEKWLA
jgi:pyruvate dehydrogenase E2 component (dihydrolipoamide acetyltransferase)